MTFDDLFDKYGTDKGPIRHYYGTIYDEVLRGLSVYTVLEIGAYEGGSLLAWAEAFPEAEVYGLDVDLHRVSAQCLAHPRIHVAKVNATKPEALAALDISKTLDLVVDDGDHTLYSQTQSFRIFHPLLRVGGRYIIEDVASEENARALCDEMERFGFVATTVHGPVADRFDNRIVIGRR